MLIFLNKMLLHVLFVAVVLPVVSSLTCSNRTVGILNGLALYEDVTVSEKPRKTGRPRTVGSGFYDLREK